MLDRREMLDTIRATLLVAAFAPTAGWARGRPNSLDQWAREVVGLKDDLKAGAIDVVGWQSRIERLNRSVDVSDLARYLEFEAVTREFRYDGLLAEVNDPVLPTEVVDAAGMSGWFVRCFGLAKGGAVIPHVHNNMVSAHMVISGSFHARTHDRLADLPEQDAVLLRPTRDSLIGVGDVISMSDRRNNQHWLVAQENRSITFDVGVVGLDSSWEYGHEAEGYNMIFIDPTVRPEDNGSIVAPRITFHEGVRRFAS